MVYRLYLNFYQASSFDLGAFDHCYGVACSYFATSVIFISTQVL
jgi:hypothetical protein